MNKLVFISGKLRDTTPELVKVNILLAENTGIELLKGGFVPVIPMTTFSNYHEYLASLGEEGFMRQFIYPILDACSYLIALPNWKDSIGAVMEVNYAEREGIPVYYSVEEFLWKKLHGNSGL